MRRSGSSGIGVEAKAPIGVNAASHGLGRILKGRGQ